MVRVFVDFKRARDNVYRNGNMVNNIKQFKAIPKLFSLISIYIMKTTVKNVIQYYGIKLSCSKIRRFLATHTVQYCVEKKILKR